MSLVSLNSLIDQAVDQMPPIRRRAYKRLLARPLIHAEIADHVASEMVDEPCCAQVVACASCDDFDGNVMMAVDPENLKAILDFIMKILPLIIKIFIGI